LTGTFLFYKYCFLVPLSPVLLVELRDCLIKMGADNYIDMKINNDVLLKQATKAI
jgi:hypothetical protein